MATFGIDKWIAEFINLLTNGILISISFGCCFRAVLNKIKHKENVGQIILADI